uniref:Uncharacterized protein n=1 Tax=Meloidogyne enterolobii TaxID=390850 RepID=A0A6V7U1D7_MELEN|nr:unnamed protein product [Meloidogyne enterolobii]
MFFLPLIILSIHFIILTKSQDPLSLSQAEEPRRGSNRLITAVRPKVTTSTWRSKKTTPRPGNADKNSRDENKAPRIGPIILPKDSIEIHLPENGERKDDLHLSKCRLN